jgi:hypothetical protein
VGYIKGRFGSLRGLRQQISNAQKHDSAIVWVKTCIVIHTLVGIIEDGDEDLDFIDELIREGIAEREQDHNVDRIANADVRRETMGQQKRTDLKHLLFENLGYVEV